LPLFVGGDLSRRATRRVRGHLQRCGPCHALYQSYRRSYVSLHRAGDAQEPEAVAEGFWPELAERLRNDRSRPRRRLGRVGSGSLGRIAVAATLLVAFGAGFFLADLNFRGRAAGPSGSPAGGGESFAPIIRPEFSTPVYASPDDWDGVDLDVPGRVDSFHFRKKLPSTGYRTVEPRYRPVAIPAAGTDPSGFR
jgi:hypothetical protein